jgi:predicted nucleic acid-binding protein
VARETLYIHVLTDGIREQEPVDLSAFFTSGFLHILRPESDDEFQALIHYATLLDDGEAMTCAIATRRDYRIATDEKKTIRLLGSQVSILGTLDMLRAWEESASISGSIMREALAAIEERGYVPGSTHPHYAWWRQRR